MLPDCREEQTMRVALLGCGFMGRMHGAVYTRLEGPKLALCISKSKESAEEVAAPHGAEASTDFDAVYSRSDIDVVDICLPTHLHAEAAIRAMESGKDVLCEKPIALTVEDADRMIEVSKSTGKKLMIAQCIRFWPEYAKLVDIVRKGRLGRLRSLQLTRFGAFPTWSVEGWLGREEFAGGAALDMHIHDTDFALYLLGRPDSVYSRGTNDDRGLSRIFTIMEFGPVVCQLEGGWDLPPGAPFKHSFRAVFDEGFVMHDAGPLTVFAPGKEPEVPELPKMSADGVGGNISDLGGYYFEMDYFYKRLADGHPMTEATPESSRDSLKTALLEIEQAKAHVRS